MAYSNPFKFYNKLNMVKYGMPYITIDCQRFNKKNLHTFGLEVFLLV